MSNGGEAEGMSGILWAQVDSKREEEAQGYT